MLWGFIRGMQYIIHISLIDITISPLASYFFSLAMVLQKLDIMGGEQIVGFLFNFKNELPLDYKFGLFGFESMNFLQTTGSMIFPLFFVLIGEFILAHLVNYCALKNRQYECCRSLGVMVHPVIINFKQNILRFFIEGYFGLAFSTCIQLKAMIMCRSLTNFKMMHFSDSGDIWSTVFTLIAVPLLILISLVPHYLKKMNTDYERSAFIQSHLAYFKGLKDSLNSI